MSEVTYWFLAQAQQGVHPVVAVSSPLWPEAMEWLEEQGDKEIKAPMLFTSLEAAEEELRKHNESASGSYLDLRKEHGEEVVNEAYDNSQPLEVFGLSAALLVGKLEDAEFPYVMVDGELRNRGNLIQELRDGA